MISGSLIPLSALGRAVVKTSSKSMGAGYALPFRLGRGCVAGVVPQARMAVLLGLGVGGRSPARVNRRTSSVTSPRSSRRSV